MNEQELFAAAMWEAFEVDGATPEGQPECWRFWQLARAAKPEDEAKILREYAKAALETFSQASGGVEYLAHRSFDIAEAMRAEELSRRAK